MTILNTLAGFTGVTLADLGGIAIPAHPATINLLDYALRTESILLSQDLAALISSNLVAVTLTNGQVINSTNVADFFKDFSAVVQWEAADNSITLVDNKISLNLDPANNALVLTPNGIQLPDNAFVTSINGSPGGAVTITADDIPAGTINTYATEAVVASNPDVAANTAARHNAVTLGSANGLALSGQELSLNLATGSASGALSSSDKLKIDALTGQELQPGNNISELTNDANFITASGAPVQSVNGSAGIVILDSDDISEGASNLYFTNARVSASPAVVANTAKVSATGSVTTHSDVTSAGSGQIITTPERTQIGNNALAITALQGQAHDSVTLGTPNGLSLTGQQLSLNVASTTTAGAMSAADKTKLNGIQTGAQVNTVTSVNTQTGAVSLTTTNISEGTNLYYTEARVNSNTNVAANTAVRHNPVSLVIPSNGLSITAAQQLGLSLATGSASGALSAADKAKLDTLFVPGAITKFAAVSDFTFNLNTATTSTVPFSGGIDNDGSGFSSPNNTQIIVNFTGTIIVGFNIPCESTGSRVTPRAWITRTTGANVAADFASAIGYLRNAEGATETTLNGSLIIRCTAGDIFTIQCRKADSSTNATPATMKYKPSFWAVRVR